MNKIIESFNNTSGKVISLNRDATELIFSQKYNGIDIKIIGEEACLQCQAQKVDLYNTVITQIEAGAFAYAPIEEFILPPTIQIINQKFIGAFERPIRYIRAMKYFLITIDNEGAIICWRKIKKR